MTRQGLLFKLMSTSEGTLTLSQLFRNRRPKLEQVIAFLEQLHKAKQEGTLTKRMGILNSIAKFLFTATKLWIEDVGRFRYEICYNPVNSFGKRTQRRNSTANKSRHRPEQTRRKEMTIDQILADSVQKTLSYNNSSLKITPRREAIMPAIVTTQPALQPEAIQMNSLEETAISNRSFQLGNATVAEQKMMTYHKVLAGDREELNVTAMPTLSSTRKKRTSTKRKTTMVRDEDIYLDEGRAKQLSIQKLSTKVKMARDFKGDPIGSFENRLKKLNPTLTNIQQLRIKLSQKLSKRQVENQYQTHIQETENQSYLQQNSLEQKFIINESNNPAVTAVLQSKLANILEGELFVDSRVNFRQFCSKRKITREIKGELFYQLLHMDFPLEQANPANFGDIFINPR